MPHVSSIQLHSESDHLVTVSFSVQSDKVTLGADEAFVSTGAESAIRVPVTLMKESEEAGYVVFEARVTSDVASAMGSISAELFRMAYTNQAD